jgi:hypothetical protein
MASKTKETETDSKGIPLKHVGYPDQFSVAAFYAIGHGVLGSIGLAAAWFLAYAPDSKRTNADNHIEILIEHNLGWLYLGIFLLKLLQIPIGTILGEARKASKAAVPDQHVYLRFDGDRGCPWRLQPCPAGFDELSRGIPYPRFAVRCGQLGLPV